MEKLLNTVCALAATTIVVAGCTDYTSATNLNPEGPPMVEQVRMKESYLVGGSLSERKVFGFGTHPDALEQEVHAVTSARVKGNGFRVVMDELLVGNNLEEVGCRAQVDADAYARVPLGTTPDDIAKCATAQDVLPSTCKGQYATCMCELDAGCVVGTETIAKGGPVGIDDKNQDGAPDDTRLINGSVGVRCGTIDVPIDLNMSYWNPSGNQQPPAMGGFDALGPAIVLIPQMGLPSNIDCQLVFASDVVDKQGVQVCAPANGDVYTDPDHGCTPGDTAQVKFKTEPMVFGAPFDPNTTGVSRVDPLIFTGITPLDASSVTGVTIMQGATAFTTFTVTINMTQNLVITPNAPGFAANTAYTVTLTTGIKDAFMQPLPAPFSLTFTTGA